MSRIKRMLMTTGMLAMFVAASADAADLRANVSFKFKAGASTLPAGQYVFSASGQGGTILVRNANASQMRSEVRVVTRLARTAAGGDSARLVFDKVGDQSFLSEVWMPGQDGFLVRGTTQKHEHEVVTPAK